MQEDKLFALTRALMDVDTSHGEEGPAAMLIADHLREWGSMQVQVWAVAPGRLNVFACRGMARVILSTHLDTVPPFIASREDDEAIHGRGACDAKGVAAAQIFAAQELLDAGQVNFGLLFVVGEERDSLGAASANERQDKLAPLARYLVNGEPTELCLATAGKGALRLNLRARGRAAHSAYPELGESATDKLIEALDRLQRLELPRNPELGSTTVNVGTLAGGIAPNVIADEAHAEVLIRLVEDAAPLRQQIVAALGPLIECDFVLEIPPTRFVTLPGFPTCTVAFGTDCTKLSAFGEPLLYGPGSIRVAHTENEHVRKADLLAAVRGYREIVTELLRRTEDIPPAPAESSPNLG
ncbi:MAG: M20/M25/M40 family metallo-hydrolase [Terriglobales bacterium]